MDLTYTTKSGESKKAIRVPFNPPLAGYEDVKGRLLQMKVDAEEALGMVRPFPFPPLSPPFTQVFVSYRRKTQQSTPSHSQPPHGRPHSSSSHSSTRPTRQAPSPHYTTLHSSPPCSSAARCRRGASPASGCSWSRSTLWSAFIRIRFARGTQTARCSSHLALSL